MAKACYLCGKKASIGMKVSHSHKRSKRAWKPNLQHFRTKIDGRTRTVSLCAKCVKSGKLPKVTS